MKVGKVNNRIAAVAAMFLAFICLGIAIYQIQLLLPLLDNGQRVHGIVSGIERGARNSRWAIYTFKTIHGKHVTQRDRFQMYIIRPVKGDNVTVIYDPEDVTLVTADLGVWTWQGPVIFLFGFVFLFVLGLLILKYNPGKSGNHT